MDQGFTFDDILIKPKAQSDVKSRSLVSTQVTNGVQMTLKVPVITASMAMFDTLGPFDTTPYTGFAEAMAEAGGMHIFSRAIPFKERLEATKEVRDKNLNVGIAVSVGELEKHHSELKNSDFVVSIDVANGAIIGFVDLGVTPYIIGNFANPEAVSRLGKDFKGKATMKFGVGSGSACTTRVVTGVGYPQASLIYNARRNNPTGAIISDGGVKNTGDFVKAIALGADFVMTGRLFGGCEETPWPTFTEGGQAYKPYRGMASEEQKGSKNHVEGVSGRVPLAGTVESVMGDLSEALTSAMSYVDSFSVPSLHRKAEFVYAPTHNLESRPRV